MPTELKRVALQIETSLASGRLMLRGISQFAHEQGNWQLFHDPRGLLEPGADWLENWTGDGVIARIQEPTVKRLLLGMSCPVVDALGVIPDPRIPVVHVDDYEIGQLAARFFLDMGLRNFAFFGIREENWSAGRMRGFSAAAEDARGSLRVLELPRREEAGSAGLHAALSRWLRDIPLPAGIMVCSDQRALPLLEACRHLDIPVPEIASVISVDNDECLCELSTPTLTSIRAGHFRAGYEAASLLDRMMSGAAVERGSRIWVDASEIVERGSTESPPVQDRAVARGLRFLRENLAGNLTNERIAREAGVSRTVFQARFRSQTGQTVQDYIRQLRIQKVARLMKNERLSLAQIAALCGFRHQQYLGYIVRRELGKTPAAWRREICAGGGGTAPALQ